MVGHKNGWCVTRPICIHMHLHLHLSVYYTYARPIHAPATVPATVQADVAACKHAIARACANTTILTPYLLCGHTLIPRSCRCVMDTNTYGGDYYPKVHYDPVNNPERCEKHGLYGYNPEYGHSDPARGLHGFTCNKMVQLLRLQPYRASTLLP